MKKFHFGVIIRNVLYDVLKPVFMILPSNTIRVLFIKGFQMGGVKLGSMFISQSGQISEALGISK